MNSKTLKKLKDEQSKEVEDLAKTDDPEQKQKLIGLITQSQKLIDSIEKESLNRVSVRKRDNLEERKFNHQLRLDEGKQSLERDEANQKVLENDLEERKFEFDKANAKETLVNDKKSKRLDIVVNLLGIVIPVAVYTGLSLLDLKLIYKDNGLPSTELKDFVKNVIHH